MESRQIGQLGTGWGSHVGGDGQWCEVDGVKLFAIMVKKALFRLPLEVAM